MTDPAHGFDSYDVLGVPVTVTTPTLTAEAIERWSHDEIGRFVCLRDVASLMAIRDDPDIAPLHRDASVVTPDGRPLAELGKRRGLPVEQTSGYDLFDAVCARSPRSGLKHYVYGGEEGVAQDLAQVMRTRYPGICIVGVETPPMGEPAPREAEFTRQRILASGADVVWVGLSSPRQDVWMWRNHTGLPQTLIGIGAAFDFHTGRKQRAPRIVRVMMLEWLYRLLAEPKRLWRRYLVMLPRFVWLSLLDKGRRKNRERSGDAPAQ